MLLLENMLSLKVIATLICLCSLQYSIADEILGCGGFVKSDVPIDFSQIEIQLYTSEGLLKYQTECAPNNGYFMVPYVEKGSFVLKIHPPQGWLFEPMSVQLDVDGVTDDCSKGKDINFIFTGFIVSGQISSVGSIGVGPQNIVLEMRSSKSDTPIKTTKSLENGAFDFNGVLPGEYQIQAKSDLYTFDKKAISVAVKTSNTKCKEDIIISGFNIEGQVSAQSQPVSGVHLLLFTKSKLPKEIKGCSLTKPEGADQLNCPGFPVFVCTVTSSGKYLFENLPSAEYAIVPYHKGKRTQYEVEPVVLKVLIKNQHVTSGNNFKVTGYSVQGRILTSDGGRPVVGAKVYVSENYQDTTDANGFYTVKHRYAGPSTTKAASLDVAVKKEDLEFLHHKFEIAPSTSLLPTIFPHAFSVCGHVLVTDFSPDFDATQLTVKISLLDQVKQVQVSNLDKNGLFCFMKPKGEYNLKIVVPKSMEKSGLVIHPSIIKAKVVDSPVKNIAFYQYRADCSIKLSCIHTCMDVVVELTSVVSGKKQRVTVDEKGNQTSINFRSMLPGEYTVSVHHDDWCWAQDSEKIVIAREKRDDSTDLAHMKQSGFLLVCSISHDVEMVIHHDGEEADTFSLKKGRNRMCLSRLGKYTLEPRSCHRFDAQSPITFDTNNPRPITLHALAHQAVITLQTTKSYLQSKLTEEKISAQVRSSRGKVTKDYFVPQEARDSETDEIFYRLTYWANDGETIEIIPSSSVLLFEPATLSVTMRAGECANELARFKGIVGIFLEGHVTPALANVNIVITTDKDDTTTLKTGKDGRYRIGPLHPDGKYEISANLEDFAMTPEEGKKGCFLAKKLSKLIFKITSENSESPLPGVLLSISGGSYRSNNLTGADGTLVLTKLEPGSYYFKAIMKEYQFDPPSKVIEIIEGAKTEIDIVGKRVAYSAHGIVTSLNGEPEIGVHLVALSLNDDVNVACKGLGEEGLTESDGTFRIRGLHPNCTYELKVRDKEDKFSRITPPRLILSVANEDINNLRFIAFRPLTGFELSGYVMTSNEFLPMIKIGLYRAGEVTSSTPVHVVSLSKESPFFQFPTLPRDKKEYIARLECSLSADVYEYTTPAAGFFAGTAPHKHITFSFDPQRKSIEPETSHTPIIALPLTLLVVILAYYHEALFAWIRQYYWKFGKRNSGNELSNRGSRRLRK